MTFPFWVLEWVWKKVVYKKECIQVSAPVRDGEIKEKMFVDAGPYKFLSP